MSRAALFALLSASSLCTGCGGSSTAPGDAGPRDGGDAAPPAHRPNRDIEWRDQVIYQVLVDRWENGDTSNDFRVDPTSMQRYHGGDWRGLTERLDYLEELGITAIWISPVVENVEDNSGSAGFHGYSASDFARPNPHFGDLVALREFVDAAHARGILVILDIVTNHIGQLFYYDVDDDGEPGDRVASGGANHTCYRVCASDPDACSADERRYCQRAGENLVDVNEWDPLYDPRGVRSTHDAEELVALDFLDWADLNRRAPPRPPAALGWPDDVAWFDDPAWYHRRGRAPGFFSGGEYSRAFQREVETYADFGGGLWGMNTDHPLVQEAFFRIYAYWVEVADFDGFRIDTVKHVDRPDLEPNVRGFWGDFAPRMRAYAASLGKESFFMFGEGFDGNDDLLAAYTQPGFDSRGVFARLDSMLHFANLWRGVNEVVRDGGATRNIECLLAARTGAASDRNWCGQRGFPSFPTYHTEPVAPRELGGTGLAPSELLVSFIDNHDVPRFLASGASVEALHNALFYLLTWDGVPCLYYGTEQQFDGGSDPANREDMWLGNPERGLEPFDTRSETFRYLQSLLAMRRAHPALRRGDITIRYATEHTGSEPDAGLLAFERTSPEETVLVVLNTSRSHASITCDPAGGECMSTSFPPGTLLRDVAPGGTTTHRVTADGTLELRVPPRGSLVLVRND